MEKLELKKRLEKKKAYLVCLIVFLALVTPTLLSLCRALNLGPSFQAGLFGGILVIIAYVYKKMNRVRVQIKSLTR
jgi:folate-dependent phosphoribosylglycinamide formyltransferase PurN